MAVESFEDAYSSTCECKGENLSWEWNEDDLTFKAICSCMKRYALFPVRGNVEVTDETQEEVEE